MDNQDKMEYMTDKKVWAVIGATPSLDKISNKIYHTLKSHGYDTYAINPYYDEMDNGDKCYSHLNELPVVPDCVDIVVPPSVTRQHIEAMDPKVYPNIWLQPGTYDDDIVEYAENKGFTVVHEGACIMAYLRLRG